MENKLTFLLYLIVFSFESIGNEFVIHPIPPNISYDKEKAKLGKKLFFDPKLSRDGAVACVSCHNPRSGADSRPFSIGIQGKKGNANSPTVFNSAFNFRQMWSGRAKDLKEQVRMPVHNPVEMGMDEKRITRYLNKDPEYASLFSKIYHRRANFNDMSDAIAEFEKALITPDSRFDLFLRKKGTLTDIEMRGYKLFKQLGCITCHNGINLGGNSFQKMGLISDEVLKKVANALQRITPKNLKASLYRMGGDDFGILFERTNCQMQFITLVKEYQEKLQDCSVDVEGLSIDLSFAIGASEKSNWLFETADMVLKAAKKSQRKRYMVYSTELDNREEIAKNIQALRSIRKAISEESLVPYFQPIRHRESGQIHKFEALARIELDGGKHILHPYSFIHAANEAKLSGEITIITSPKNRVHIKRHSEPILPERIP